MRFLVLLLVINNSIGLSAIDAVSGSGIHICAIKNGGDLYCWGGNDYGQLGLGKTTNTLQPTKVEGSYLKVAAQRNHTCAIDTMGKVKCIGDNKLGQLGHGLSYQTFGQKSGETLEKASAVDLGTDLKVKEIRTGASHSCALFENGSAKCWGSNYYGELGLGVTQTSIGTKPSQMGIGLSFIDVGSVEVEDLALGKNFTCAKLKNGDVKCWGKYDFIGSESKENVGTEKAQMGNYLKPLSLQGKAHSLVAGALFACALLTDGKVKCWGKNEEGVLGVGKSAKATIGDEPSEMGEYLQTVPLGGSRATGISAGYLHACATLSNRAMKCWGSNQFGELGVGDTVSRGVHLADMGEALPFVSLPPFAKVKEVFLGSVHSCAILSDEKLRCWGVNSFGQLGNKEQVGFGSSPETMGEHLPWIEF